MNAFEMRWKTCVARGSRATGPEETPPLGFATRVLSAVAAQRSTLAAPVELVWQRLAVRSLGLVGVLLIICAIVELPHLRDRRPLEPGIENTVAQVVWSL